ncbi:mannose-6-phosphate isomerase [Lewinellaceae bacterium SD302]|nr:mannose-6-phosphate isomerase [Lewinellaceae bacterium SD302]
MSKPINVLEKFSQFDEHWTPHVISELNGQAVKLAKVKGEFVWHDHAEEDELFLIYRGTLFLDFRDGETVAISPGEFYVVPRGVEHRPYTKDEEEVWLLLLEPIGTKHTGEVDHELTVKEYKRLD